MVLGALYLLVLSFPGIRQLQLLLLKVALLLGVEIHWGVTFTGLQPPTKKGKYFSAPENPHLPRTPWPVEEKGWVWESSESPFLECGRVQTALNFILSICKMGVIFPSLLSMAVVKVQFDRQCVMVF